MVNQFCIFVLIFYSVASAAANSNQVVTPNVSAQVQAVQKAADENVNKLLAEIKRLKSKSSEGTAEKPKNTASMNINYMDILLDKEPHHNRCDDDDRSPTCAANCTYRYANGSCASYGSDFCAPKASCAAKCTSRYTNGECASYGADLCGSEMNCSAHCIVRYTDGQCASYTADFCGPEANCSLNCTRRYSSGECASYGSDICY